jgi:hypothetical protein
MELVQIKTSAESKERWVQFVESHNAYTSVSGLIRHSVERHIADERSADDDGRDVEQLIDEFDSLHSELSDVEDKVELMRREVLNDDELYELVAAATEKGVEMYETER